MMKPELSLPIHDVEYELPDKPMFDGYEVGLIIDGLIAEVVSHEITMPTKTWVKEAGTGKFHLIPNSLRGVIYGKGPVRFFRQRGFIMFRGEEFCLAPHGTFEELTNDEREKNPTATWKYCFDHTVKPCSPATTPLR